MSAAPLQSTALPTELGLGEDRLTEGGKEGKREKMRKKGERGRKKGGKERERRKKERRALI